MFEGNFLGGCWEIEHARRDPSSSPEVLSDDDDDDDVTGKPIDVGTRRLGPDLRPRFIFPSLERFTMANVTEQSFADSTLGRIRLSLGLPQEDDISQA